MPISKKMLSANTIQAGKIYLGLAIKPSKRLRAKCPEIAKLPTSLSSQNSECPKGSSKVVKPENTHNARAKFEKQAIPRRNIFSQSQGCISDGDAAIRNRINSENMLNNAVQIEIKCPAIGASNKHTTDNSNPVATPTKNIQNVTGRAIPTSTNVDAPNDNGYKVNLSPVSVIPLPEQGVLLQNENCNLPISTKVKAVVLVDGLSMTNEVPPHQHEEALKAIEDLRKADKDELHLRKQPNKHGSRYNKNYKIYDGDQYLGFLSAEPLKKTDRFLRLDFNPSKILRSGCKIVAQAIRSIIGVNATEVINRANITRLDIAVDLHGIEINKLLYFSSRPIDSCTFGKIFKHGKEIQYHQRMETQCIGSTDSDHNFVVYDKRAERIAKSKGKDDPGHEIVRVELRIKPRQAKGPSSNIKCSVQFDNIESFGNLFKKLGITEIPTPSKDDGQFALFVYAAQHVGTHTALALVKCSRKRGEYRKRLLGQAASCWKPDEYWARAIDAVKKTLASIS